MIPMHQLNLILHSKMFSKLVALCALVAVSQAGLLAEPAHYSSAGAVSSQSIVRHDESHGHQLVAAPVAKLAVAAPVYHAAPQLQYAAPQAHYAAPQVHYAAPQAHYAAPQVHYAAPQAHYAAPQVHYAAPQVHYAAPVAKVLAPAHKLLVASHDEEYAHPKYEYAYSVADGHTGDNKSQQETRDGDVVKGSYSLHEADGSIRTVEYSADDHSGFNAVVHNTAPTHAPAYVKAAPLLVKAAPALQYYHH